MIIPDVLWVPAPKDLKAQFAPQRVQRFTSTLAAAQAQILHRPITVDGDYVFFWLSVMLRAVAGGAQTVTRLRALSVVLGTAETSGSIFDVESATGGVTTARGGADRAGAPLAILMPEETVELVADFSAGVAGNTLETSIYGVLIPRGNWQLG